MFIPNRFAIKNDKSSSAKPLTPTTKSIMPPLSARKPFGGEISIKSVLGI